MKSIAIILLSYNTILVTAPPLCAMEEVLKKAGLCCTEQNSASDEESTPCAPCCTVQSCQCYFTPTLEYNFTVKDCISLQAIPVSAEAIPTGYLSECWHPPERVWFLLPNGLIINRNSNFKTKIYDKISIRYCWSGVSCCWSNLRLRMRLLLSKR